ncbi:MAG TPA: RRQRL motif-containing zinc-binding protein [Actinoplanes sp.]
MAKTIINDPTGERSPDGLPTFVWGCAPRDQYATRRQLAAMGLRKGGQDVAALMHGWCHGVRTVMHLYRIDLAKPRRPWTAAKQAAVQKAANARKKCDACERRWPELQYVPHNGVCNPCTDAAQYAIEERAA